MDQNFNNMDNTDKETAKSNYWSKGADFDTWPLSNRYGKLKFPLQHMDKLWYTMHRIGDLTKTYILGKDTFSINFIFNRTS